MADNCLRAIHAAYLGTRCLVFAKQVMLDHGRHYSRADRRRASVCRTGLQVVTLCPLYASPDVLINRIKSTCKGPEYNHSLVTATDDRRSLGVSVPFLLVTAPAVYLGTGRFIIIDSFRLPRCRLVGIGMAARPRGITHSSIEWVLSRYFS